MGYKQTQLPFIRFKMNVKRRDADDASIFRIPPYHFIHVLDQTSNVTRIETGPKTFIRQENEKVLFGPDKMIIVPPHHYCVIQNPVVRNDKSEIQLDFVGQVKLQHAELEIRLPQDPFPLYPGEVLSKPVSPLKVVATNSALRLRAIRDFTDGATSRVAGDEWLFEGPGTYIPRKEVEFVEKIRATTILVNQALKLRAQMELQDRDGKTRVTGEEWLVRRTGAYLPSAYEEVVTVVDAYVLTEKEAIHVRATRSFTDILGKSHKNGEEWLVSLADTETYIPDVYEEVVGVINITTLTNREYCVILNPCDAGGKPQLGQKKLVEGEKSFFLLPGEELEQGIRSVYVLSETEGLILRASQAFNDDNVTSKVRRSPGDTWMIRGPCDYIPPIEVEVLSQRDAIPLDDTEGIYVQDVKSGKASSHYSYTIRAVCGETYMLTQDEELWSKPLPPVVEELLQQNRDPLSDRGTRKITSSSETEKRDKTYVVTFRVPHNAVVQIYDYKEKKARFIFGPDLVMLGPSEQFTKLSLSGGKPKRPNVIKALALLLGPDFCTDIVIVETADHARLQLQLSYNWYFEVKDHNAETAAKLFSVPDFIGDACKAIASRIRGAVASVQFDDFHKNSAKIIRASVFGYDESSKIRSSFTFKQNGLTITSVDIQSVEPVDQRTRDSLQKSVQLAIEITTNSQEAAAKHEADRIEQEAKGRLERQKITDEVEAERARKQLLELQAASAAVESCGQATAEASSRASAAKIEGEAAVAQARLRAEAAVIEAESELNRLTNAREAEIKYLKDQNELEVTKSTELMDLEVKKFEKMVSALGSDTIKAMAIAGPEMQVKMLQGLGLSSTLITDGQTPINLFTTAHGLIGSAIGEASPSKVPRKV
ncbi:Major vault protein [Nymphon striatum]|nr:Major vault protein [Nymphon striatum]